MRSRSLKYSLIFVTLMAVAVLPPALFMKAGQSSGQNWLGGWTYRKSITIQNANGAGTNYQVPITVYYNSTPSSSLSWYPMSSNIQTISGNPTDQHGFCPVHNTAIVQCNLIIDGAVRTYLAYDSDSGGNNIYLYYSDTINGTWTAYSGNPILSSAGNFRSPSVAYVGGTFQMFLNSINNKDVERWTSTDGKTFTKAETVLTTTYDQWTAPFIWLNPNDNYWYLFWTQGNNAGSTWSNMARTSTSITGFSGRADTIVLTETPPLSNCAWPTIMYRDNTYWLLTEGTSGGVWNVNAWYSTSPTSGYSLASNSPILTNSEACPEILLDSSGNCYLFTNQNSASWYQLTRNVYEWVPPISLNGHCKSDFGDVRFTASDGSTLLNYYLQTMSSGSYANFCVQDTDDLTSMSSTIYVYYGNSGAATTSNGKNTFLFFDNFSADSSIDWTTTWQSSTQSLYSLSGGNLVCSKASSGSQLIQTKTSYSGGFCAEALVKETSSTGQAYFDMEQSGLSYTGKDLEILDYTSGTYGVYLGGASNTVSSTRDTTDFFTLVYECPSSGSATGQIWLGSTLEVSFSHAPSYTTAHISFLAFGSGTAVVQWVYGRKYVNPEPSVSAVGTEETLTVYTLTVSVVGNGVVNLDKSGPYTYGDVVHLTAVADMGWTFAGWSGDLTGYDNPGALTITRNMAVTATFTPPSLQMSPAMVTCRKYNETFSVSIAVSNEYGVTGFKFEIHYNTTLLDYAGVTWNAWPGSGTTTVDEAIGNMTGITFGSAISGAQTLVTIQFNATYYHIWKDETRVSGWKNSQSGTIYIQWANLSYPTGPDLGYVRGGSQNQFNVGSDVTYTFSPIQGDLDNNGLINVSDLRTVAAYYDVKQGDPLWPTASAYDLNGDGTIDIFDLVGVGANFGVTYP